MLTKNRKGPWQFQEGTASSSDHQGASDTLGTLVKNVIGLIGMWLDPMRTPLGHQQIGWLGHCLPIAGPSSVRHCSWTDRRELACKIHGCSVHIQGLLPGREAREVQSQRITPRMARLVIHRGGRCNVGMGSHSRSQLFRSIHLILERVEEGRTGVAQGLVLALCSEMISGRVQGTIWDAREQT